MTDLSVQEVTKLARSARKLQAELNEMGVGTRESQLEAENKRLRQTMKLIRNMARKLQKPLPGGPATVIASIQKIDQLSSEWCREE